MVSDELRAIADVVIAQPDHVHPIPRSYTVFPTIAIVYGPLTLYEPVAGPSADIETATVEPAYKVVGTTAEIDTLGFRIVKESLLLHVMYEAESFVYK